MAFDAGTLLGRLKLDLSGFTGNIIEAQGLTNTFGTTFTTALVSPMLAGLDLLKQAMGGFVDVFTAGLGRIDDTGDLAVRLGVSTEFLTRLTFAAEQAGAGSENLTTSLDFLNRTLGDVANGVRKDDPFAALGVSIRDANGTVRSTESVFSDLVRSINAVENPAHRSALAVDVLGRSGTALLPTILQGTDGLKALSAEMDRLKATVDKDLVDKAGALNDLGGLFNAGFTGLQNELIRGFVQAFKVDVTGLRDVIVQLFEATQPLSHSLGNFVGVLLANKTLLADISTIVRELTPLAQTAANALNGAVGYWETFKAIRYRYIDDPLSRTINAVERIGDDDPYMRSTVRRDIDAAIARDRERKQTIIVNVDGKEAARREIEANNSRQQLDARARG